MRRTRMTVALSAVVLGAALFAPSAATAASGSPHLVNGKKAGPVAIPVTQKTVASLPLTKGRWLVFAKAVLAGTGGSAFEHLGVDCRLTVGSRSDLVSAAPAPENADGSRVPMLLTTAGKLRSSGSALLRCAAENGGTVKIRDIRMTAIRVGTLTTRSTVTPAGRRIGPSATSGTGKPIVVSAKQASPRAVNGDAVFHPVAQLPLAAGRWWIVVKGVASDGTTESTYRCRVSAGGDADVVRFPLGLSGIPIDTEPIALQVVHDFGAPGSALLECLGDHDFQVGNVVMTAIKVGKLTNEMRPAPVATTGSGSPRVIAGWNDGPLGVPVSGDLTTILTQPLPKGKWLVVAKAWFEAGSVPSDSVLRRVTCQLGFGGVKDDVELRYWNNVTHVGAVVLQVPASTQGAQSAVLRCRRTEAGGTGDLLWVKIVALKLGSILAWAL